MCFIGVPGGLSVFSFYITHLTWWECLHRILLIKPFKNAAVLIMILIEPLVLRSEIGMQDKHYV